MEEATIIEIVKILAPALLTGLLLPVFILAVTNYHTRKSKENEKKLDFNYKTKDDIRDQEKKVYSSLSKILFDVQQLHVSLSGSCVDVNCIKVALEKFDNSINKCHSDISDNMLYLSSDAINHIYSFYNAIGELKIKLLEYDKKGEHSIAHVAVYYSSEQLAEILMNIQGLFISQRGDAKVNFDKSKQENMRYCCGKPPSKELAEKYEELNKSIANEC